MARKKQACYGCIYSGWIGDHLGCNYIFIMNKRRPCPPGKDCTVKLKKKKGQKVADNG